MVQAPRGSHPKGPGLILTKGAHAGVGQRAGGGRIRLVKLKAAGGQGVEQAQTFGGADPKQPGPIDQQRVNPVPTKALGVGRLIFISHETFRRTGPETVQATSPGSDPKRAGWVFGQGGYAIAAETPNVGRIVTEVVKLFARAASITIQAAVHRPDPHRPRCVLVDGRDMIAGEGTGVVRIMTKAFEPHRFGRMDVFGREKVQAAFRADPKIAGPVRQDRGNAMTGRSE